MWFCSGGLSFRSCMPTVLMKEGLLSEIGGWGFSIELRLERIDPSKMRIGYDNDLNWEP